MLNRVSSRLLLIPDEGDTVEWEVHIYKVQYSQNVSTSLIRFGLAY